jgi:predicted protein tyrosine phosphatase
LPFFWEKKHQYLRVDILDLPSQNIRKHFDTVIEFIGSCFFSVPSAVNGFLHLDNALQSNGNVLVHCSAGISRSPTLVLAYLMKKNHWTLDQAFEKMRKLRQIVDPNVSFIIQLREWEKNLFSAASNASAITEKNDESSGATSRTTASTYCGSTSKSKARPTDAPIIVN